MNVPLKGLTLRIRNCLYARFMYTPLMCCNPTRIPDFEAVQLLG